MAVSVRTGMSVAEFMEKWSEEGPFEIIDGEIIKLSPQAARSGRLAFKLARLLQDFVEQQNLGEIFVEVPFTLGETENWVEGSKVPDVMFVSQERLQPLEENKPDWDETPLPMPPDLAIEVVSPSDRFSKVVKKVERYLADGVPTAWVIDPGTKTISIFTAGSNQVLKLNEKDTLSGGDLIPGFTLPLEQLFA